MVISELRLGRISIITSYVITTPPKITIYYQVEFYLWQYFMYPFDKQFLFPNQINIMDSALDSTAYLGCHYDKEITSFFLLLTTAAFGWLMKKKP